MLSLRYDLTVPFARFIAMHNTGNIKVGHSLVLITLSGHHPDVCATRLLLAVPDNTSLF